MEGREGARRRLDDGLLPLVPFSDSSSETRRLSTSLAVDPSAQLESSLTSAELPSRRLSLVRMVCSLRRRFPGDVACPSSCLPSSLQQRRVSVYSPYSLLSLLIYASSETALVDRLVVQGKEGEAKGESDVPRLLRRSIPRTEIHKPTGEYRERVEKKREKKEGDQD